MHSNIVHHYFKKELEGAKILVKLNPIHFSGLELIVDATGLASSRELEFDEAILEDLAADGFTEVNAMEFNLYLSGLAR